MQYYFSTTNEGETPVVVYAKSKFLVRVLLSDDCENISKLTAKEARKLIDKGFKFIK